MIDLNPKQLGIIRCLAKGMNSIEIAEELKASQSAIEKYKVQIYQLCEVRSSAHLVSWAYQNGILKINR